MRIETYKDDHFAGVAALWQQVFPQDAPWNTAAVAIPEKISVQPDLFLVASQGSQIVGSVMAGYDGHRGWINRIAVLPSHRGLGLGTQLLAAAEARLAALGCIKINLQVMTDNAGVVEFYRKAGYAIEPRISMAKHV